MKRWYQSSGISYIKVRDKIEKDLDFSDITAADLQDDIIGPNLIQEKRNQVTIRKKDDNYMRTLAIYVSSVFQDFESFLRTEVDLVEDDIKLVVKEYNSIFVTYELEPGIYIFQDIFEALLKVIQPEYDGCHKGIDIE